MEENISNHNLNNLLGEQQQGTKKQGDKQKLSLELEGHIIAPNTLVPFNNCIRVQNDFFIEYQNDLTAINKDVLNTDYGRDSVNNIRKYLKFVNNPEHVHYKKEIGLFYNLYRPLSHKPVKGDFSTIKKMLNHIFRGNHYRMILTYLWVLYMKPKHPLPFIGLVSMANGTGKTKFLQFLKAIFQANAKFIDAEDISADFNSSYIDKLCILIDEKIDGKHRKSDLQKYKKLVTGGTQTRKEKYQSSVDVEFYGKFTMCSNDIETMMAMEQENTRFWIVDVEKLEETDVDILIKVTAEIPAFLYHLQHEHVPLERAGRLWFSAESIQTERGKILQENSRSTVAKEVTERLIDYFIENENVNKIEFSSRHFLDAYQLNQVSSNYFSRVLKTEFNKVTKEKAIRNPFFNDFSEKRCRCFTFLREEIINKEDSASSGATEFYDDTSIDGEFD